MGMYMLFAYIKLRALFGVTVGTVKQKSICFQVSSVFTALIVTNSYDLMKRHKKF
jgi:hypothetical protein